LIAGSKVYPGREDRTAAFEYAVGVDFSDGPGVDIVANLEDYQQTQALGFFDHVECISVLEHSPRPWLIARNLELLMFPAATLHLSVPFVWRVHGYPDDYFRFTASGVRSLFPSVRWSSLVYASPHKLTEAFGSLGKIDADGTRSFLRTEIFGFGVRT